VVIAIEVQAGSGGLAVDVYTLPFVGGHQLMPIGKWLRVIGERAVE
jgi:hypothetical protein